MTNFPFGQDRWATTKKEGAGSAEPEGTDASKCAPTVEITDGERESGT